VSWQSAESATRHEGRLQFTPDLRQAQGTVTAENSAIAVAADLPPITYACDVARNTGAYVTGVAPFLEIHWDPASATWTDAAWQPDVLAVASGSVASAPQAVRVRVWEIYVRAPGGAPPAGRRSSEVGGV